MSATPQRPFLPAAGRDIFLPLYDPFVRLFGFDAIREALLAQSNLQPHHHVLDVGCGTGTLAVAIKQRQPGAEVRALDPDPKALGRARAKAAGAGVTVQFDEGFSDALPYADATFDRVFSSLMFHHLSRAVKEATLRDIHRVLKPGGELHLLDFTGAHGHGRLARLIHPQQALKDSAEDRVVVLMRDASLREPQVVSRRKTLFGPLAFYRARRAG
jgi:ubiquinone/menaquinone biosynthesis C-methylase UbiE